MSDKFIAVLATRTRSVREVCELVTSFGVRGAANTLGVHRIEIQKVLKAHPDVAEASGVKPQMKSKRKRRRGPRIHTAVYKREKEG